MTASNHYVTGIAISMVVANPILGIPLAAASHFLLDAVPHYGCKEFRDDNKGEIKLYFTVLWLDILLFISLIIATALFLDETLPILYGLAAVSPDAVWVYRYGLLAQIGRVDKKPGRIERFHMRIQWFEEVNGLFVEFTYFLLLGGIVWSML